MQKTEFSLRPRTRVNTSHSVILNISISINAGIEIAFYRKLSANKRAGSPKCGHPVGQACNKQPSAWPIDWLIM
jgi:hypothetical protein